MVYKKDASKKTKLGGTLSMPSGPGKKIQGNHLPTVKGYQTFPGDPVKKDGDYHEFTRDEKAKDRPRGGGRAGGEGKEKGDTITS